MFKETERRREYCFFSTQHCADGLNFDSRGDGGLAHRMN